MKKHALLYIIILIVLLSLCTSLIMHFFVLREHELTSPDNYYVLLLFCVTVSVCKDNLDVTKNNIVWSMDDTLFSQGILVLCVYYI